MPNLLESIQNAMGDNVTTAIYEKVNELFGAGTQLFAMEFPTRPLNPKDFEYSTDDSFSKITKPYSVQEAEFMLADDLFDCTPIVQGANGEKLSSVYTTIINNYVPSLEAFSQFVTDQSELRQWLLSPADTTAEDDNSNESRMELCKKLYHTFLEKRNEWNEEKQTRYNEAKRGENGQDLDSYSKWLSTQGLVKEEQINNLFNDAIVKGHYHEVLTLLGYLNVASPAETLEITKQKMRASLRRSLDGSSDVYPVHFNPSDWFKSLAPNISPKDLTMSKDQLIIDFKQKQKRLQNLQAQLAQLTSVHLPQDQLKDLEDKIEVAEYKVAQKEAALLEKYGKSTCNLFKTVLSIYDALNPKKGWTEASQNEDIKSILGDSVGMLTGDVQGQFNALNELTADLENLNEKRMAFTETKARDMTLQRHRIEEQIRNLQADLDFLSPLVSGVVTAAHSKKAKPVTAEDYEKLKTAFSNELEKYAGTSDNATKGDALKKVNTAKQALLQALQSYSTAVIEEKIKENTADDNSLKDETLDEVLQAALADVQKAEADALMTGDNDGSDNDFTDIIITEKATAKSGTIESGTSSSQTSVSAGFWFTSATHKSSSTSSNTSALQKDASYSLEIGLRVKKVAIDRGGWFNPTLFKLSSNFYRLSNDIRVSKGLNKAEVHNAAKKVAEAAKISAGTVKTDEQVTVKPDEKALKKLVTYESTATGETANAESEYILPTYPMSFVIAKDITIRITSDLFEDSAVKKEMDSAGSTAGGAFFFKGSRSSSSKSSSETSYSGFQGNSFYMRIPGPQILGWFLQFTPADSAMPYKAEDSEAFRVKAREELKKQISMIEPDDPVEYAEE